jgi:hypothetical protein
MKRILFLVAGVMIAASTGLAQRGNGSDATISAVTSGLFTPALTGAAAIMPVRVTRPAGSVGSAMVKDGQALSNQLALANIPNGVRTAIVGAMAKIGGGTAGSVSQGLNSLATALSSLTTAQLTAFLATDVGVEIFRTALSARQALRPTTPS